jgi:hypothetical protein
MTLTNWAVIGLCLIAITCIYTIIRAGGRIRPKPYIGRVIYLHSTEKKGVDKPNI